MEGVYASVSHASKQAGRQAGRQAGMQVVDEERNNKTKATQSKALAVAVVRGVDKHPIIHPARHWCESTYILHGPSPSPSSS